MKLLRFQFSGSPLLVFSLLFFAFLLLSFAPYRVKAALHTQGRFHAAAHLLCFALMQATWNACGHPEERGGWEFLPLILLAFAIEALQTQGNWQLFEGRDVAFDLVGTTTAFGWEWVRWRGRMARERLLHLP